MVQMIPHQLAPPRPSPLCASSHLPPLAPPPTHLRSFVENLIDWDRVEARYQAAKK